MICPACHGLLNYVGVIPVILPGLHLGRKSHCAACLNCAVISEVDSSTGRLVDLRLFVYAASVPMHGGRDS